MQIVSWYTKMNITESEVHRIQEKLVKQIRHEEITQETFENALMVLSKGCKALDEGWITEEEYEKATDLIANL